MFAVFVSLHEITFKFGIKTCILVLLLENNIVKFYLTPLFQEKRLCLYEMY